MNDFNRTPQPAPRDAQMRFTRMGIVADAHAAALTRAQFGDWLVEHRVIGSNRLGDVLLATYEALANAAEHAYLGTPEIQGTMDLRAHYDPHADRLAVTASDHGSWRDPVGESVGSTSDQPVRGRGIELMRALTDEASIRATAVGTEVQLSWSRVAD